MHCYHGNSNSATCIWVAEEVKQISWNLTCSRLKVSYGWVWSLQGSQATPHTFPLTHFQQPGVPKFNEEVLVFCILFIINDIDLNCFAKEAKKNVITKRGGVML